MKKRYKNFKFYRKNKKEIDGEVKMSFKYIGNKKLTSFLLKSTLYYLLLYTLYIVNDQNAKHISLNILKSHRVTGKL